MCPSCFIFWGFPWRFRDRFQCRKDKTVRQTAALNGSLLNWQRKTRILHAMIKNGTRRTLEKRVCNILRTIVFGRSMTRNTISKNALRRVVSYEGGRESHIREPFRVFSVWCDALAPTFSFVCGSMWLILHRKHDKRVLSMRCPAITSTRDGRPVPFDTFSRRFQWSNKPVRPRMRIRPQRSHRPRPARF